MANVTHNKGKFQLASGLIDFSANTFKIILMDNTYVPNIDTDEFLSDVSAKELADGNGYTTGGATLAGVTITEDDTNDRANVAWNTVTWTASGGDIGPSPYAVIFKDTGVAATSAIIGSIDFSGDKTVTDGQDFILTTPNYNLT